MNPIETLVNEFEKIIQWLVWDNWVWLVLGPVAAGVYSIYLLIQLYLYWRLPKSSQNIAKLTKNLFYVMGLIVLAGLYNFLIPHFWQLLDKFNVVLVTWISDGQFKDLLQAIKNYEKICIFASQDTEVCLSYSQAILQGLQAEAKPAFQQQLSLALVFSQLAFILYIVGLLTPYYIVKFSLALGFVLGGLFIFSPIWQTTRAYFRRWMTLLLGMVLGYLGLIIMSAIVSVVFTRLLITILPTIQDSAQVFFYACNLLIATVILLLVWFYCLRIWFVWVGPSLQKKRLSLAQYLLSLLLTLWTGIFKPKKKLEPVVEVSVPTPEFDKPSSALNPALPSRQVHKIISNIKNNYPK